MKSTSAIAILTLSTAAACSSGDNEAREYMEQLQQELVLGTSGNAHSLHLEENLRFNSIRPGSDADNGRALFGLAADLNTSDTSLALFQGFSITYGPGYPIGSVVQSNGRTCFTCHRGVDQNLGLPAPPLSDTIALTDPIWTGIQADAQGDPDALANLDEHALVKYRPNRFNLARGQDDPFRKVFFWRKAQPLINLVFSRGFLNDGRARLMFETARGAVFSHTQETDGRFDDLFSLENSRDLEAFQFSQLTDPALAALLDPNDPMHNTLKTNPFHTVPVSTAAEWRGRNVFVRDCMSCHNTPNVFNNISNVQATGTDLDRPAEFPTHGPNVGRGFNIGVSERNKHGLRFSAFIDGGYEQVTLQLADEDGDANMHTVTFDIGMAATTARTADIGRFKVPQLRNISQLGPYFHDNSADTLEEVIEYFNSNAYNHSHDGKRHKIDETAKERADLLAFLQIL